MLMWVDCGQWLGSWHGSCLAQLKVHGKHRLGTVAIVIELRFCLCWLDTMASKKIWVVRCHNLWRTYEFESCHTLSAVSVQILSVMTGQAKHQMLCGPIAGHREIDHTI